MAKMSDIELSQSKKGQQTQAPTLGGATMMEMTTPLKFIIFRLVKKKRGRTHIDGRCDNVLNPKTQKRERIWLLNGADSIWQSDLIELLKDKEYVRRNLRSLTFEDGVCRIFSDDELALEFARANRKNVGRQRVGAGPFNYYEYDAAEEQKERYRKQTTKIEMIIKAKEMADDKVKKLASFFNIHFVDDLGSPKSIDGIRTELMLKADNDPDTFARYIDAAEVEISYLVKRAIIDAKIDLTGTQGSAVWSGGKGFIGKIPASRKAHEYLTELAMTNSDEGKAFKEQLQTMIG